MMKCGWFRIRIEISQLDLGLGLGLVKTQLGFSWREEKARVGFDDGSDYELW